MAGLHEGHLELLRIAAPDISEITQGLYLKLTESLNPHLPVLPALMAMVEAVLKEDFGVLGKHKLVRLPLSIIGSNKVRYRTEVVEWLHETILSVRMSDLTVEHIRQTLRIHGLCILFKCSCGVVMGRCEDVQAYYGTNEHQRMDRLRSAIDAMGSPVESVVSFDDIMVPTMDLHANGAEERLFDRIEELTRLAASADHRDYPWIDAELMKFIDTARAHAAVA